MINLLIICSIISFQNDTTVEIKNGYTKNVLISAALCISFTIGTGVFYTLGNKAYEDYKESKTIKSALDNWDRVELYDNLRNVCMAGGLIFLVRAIYYQLKDVQSLKSTRYIPNLQLEYADDNVRLKVGVSQSL